MQKQQEQGWLLQEERVLAGGTRFGKTTAESPLPLRHQRVGDAWAVAVLGVAERDRARLGLPQAPFCLVVGSRAKDKGRS